MRGVLGEAQLVRVCSQKRKPYTEMKTNRFCLIGTSFPWDTVRGGGQVSPQLPLLPLVLLARPRLQGAPGGLSLVLSGTETYICHVRLSSASLVIQEDGRHWMGWEQKVGVHHGLTAHRIACYREAVRGPGFPWQHPETLVPCVML